MKPADARDDNTDRGTDGCGGADGGGGGGGGGVWPPAGFVGWDGAARAVGVAEATLKRWAYEGKVPRPRPVATPGGRSRLAYAAADVEQIRADLAAAADARCVEPEGFVDADGACAMLNASPTSLTKWQRAGKLAFARWGRTRDNKRYRLYAVADLRRFLRARAAAAVVVEPRPGGTVYHVPDGYVRAGDAARALGVGRTTIDRWERDGRLPCPPCDLGAGVKLYRRADVERVLAACGAYAPPYPDPDRPGVWRVPLAGHDIRRREALVDAADVPLVAGKRCHLSGRGARGEPGMVVVTDGDARPTLRQLVTGVRGEGQRVSHRNGDPLDCRRENLVARTPQASSRGYGKQSAYGGRPCSSRFKGVCLEKNTGRWVASIGVDYKTTRLGRFRDEIAAAEAYDAAARELFGGQARLNFPDGVDARLDREAAAADAAGAAEGARADADATEPARWRRTELDPAA